jgi:hypothetical protein
MKEDILQPGDDKLGRLLREARPASELPSGFQNAVWRRIEKGEQPSVGILERLAQWVLTPRLATTCIAAVVLVAAGAGAIHGMKTGEREARDKYVASVDPSYLHR